MSTPHIFDQEIVARPCRSGCVAHAHVQALPSAYDPGNNDLGGGLPDGWTAQSRPWGAPSDELWFQCNVCEALVAESQVPTHVCELRCA